MLALFGAPAFIDRGQSHALPMSEKTLALVVLLACHAERPLSRAWLASILWPDVDEVEARTNLRRHFYKLAKALPGEYGDPVKLTKNTAQWNPGVSFAVDVIEFTSAIAAGRPHDAIALYRGPLCLASFDDAVAEQRERFDQIYLKLLHDQIEHVRSAGDKASEIALLQRRAAADTLNESWICDLAQARLESGDRAGARRELTALAARLRTELRVEPEARTLQLLAQCMEHAQESTATNLPVELDSLVGRDAAVDKLVRILRSNSWVTLTGPAGIGKTRLAVHVARNHLAEFRDGVWFVDLTSTTTWDDAVTHIAGTLKISLGAEDAAQALQTFLSRRRVLIVLDNCEQLDPAASTGIDKLVDGSASTVLATSRRQLGGDNEKVYTVEHLTLPPASSDPAAVLQYSAARLFVERATSVAPSFALSHENVPHVASIVGRLDGLPLAIELIAARMNLLTIEGIAKRLDDLDLVRAKDRTDRHQTVASAIRWSYDLLAPRERTLLQRLAVFDGPFDLGAVESICYDDRDLSRSSVFAVLSELVEASLVVSISSDRDGDQRYALLETVRRFLRALPEAFTDTIRTAHAVYFAEVARQAERAYDEIGTSEYVARIRRDRANMEAAFHYAWEVRDASLLAAFVCGFERSWIPAEVKRLAHVFDFLSQENVLAQLPVRERARLLFALAAPASTAADWPRCKALREQCAACWRELGEEAEALSVEAVIALVENYMGASLKDVIVPKLYEIDKRLNEVDAPKWHSARIKRNLGSMELALGNPQTALQLVLEAIAVFRRERRTNYVVFCLDALARTYMELGDLVLAERCIEEAIALLDDPSYAVLLAQAYGLRARLQLKTGDAKAALQTCSESLRTFEYAFELRFVVGTVGITMQALTAIGRADCAARIAGYILERGRVTGTVALGTLFETSPAYREARATLGDKAFDAATQLGATYTFQDVCAEVELEAAAASETALASASA